MEVVGLLLFIAFIAAPYVAARVLWRISVPWALRFTVVLAVPVALVGWLASRRDLTDIMDPGAALIVFVMIFGWFSGATSVFRRTLIARTGGNARS
jgi:hypothetical protein